jgi:predicted kinase
MLIVFAGLPGTGKTSVARGLAEQLRATYLRIDTIEQALRSSGTLVTEVTVEGYFIAYRVAEENLSLGRTVIADSVNPIEITRDAWMGVAARAAVPAVEVEIICSDPEEHRRRLETRYSDITGLTPQPGKKSQTASIIRGTALGLSSTRLIEPSLHASPNFRPSCRLPV